MKVVHDYPPLYAEIAAAFPIKHRSVIFAWGDAIYNPHSLVLNDALRAHEDVHRMQHESYEGGPEAWWRRYIADKAFRLDQEVPAHAAEYMVHAVLADSRKRRRYLLSQIARKLSSATYGPMVGQRKALELLRKELKMEDKK
ncbi:MAG: hypothetical protein GEU78_08010 [Actinobacteria bacterium]|nr:hypothetical protein [Actinomycetota bacterium]